MPQRMFHSKGKRNMSNKIQVFYSYSSKDEVLFNALDTHLIAPRKQGIMEEWELRRAIPGEEIGKEISRNIEEADIIILLISSDYLSTSSCIVEMQHALARHQSGHAHVVPVIVRAVDLTDTDFSHLACLPTGGKSITSWENHDEAWVNVVRGIARVIERWQSAKLAEHEKQTKLSRMKVLVMSLTLLSLFCLTGFVFNRVSQWNNETKSTRIKHELNQIRTYCNLGWETYCSKEFDLFNSLCNPEDQDSCNYLGSIYQSGRGTQKDIQKSLTIYSATCEKGNIDGCVNLARIYDRGKEAPKDQNKAFSLYQDACKAGSSAGCARAGLIYEDWHDYVHASLLLRRACENSILSACSDLGRLYKHGNAFTDQGRPEPANMTSAHDLFRKIL